MDEQSRKLALPHDTAGIPAESGTVDVRKENQQPADPLLQPPFSDAVEEVMREHHNVLAALAR